jgi:hypothetical protein
MWTFKADAAGFANLANDQSQILGQHVRPSEDPREMLLDWMNSLAANHTL